MPVLNLWAQTSGIDSLKAVITVESNDTLKVNQLNQLAEKLLNSEPLEAKLYAQQALQLAQNSKFISGQALSLTILGQHAQSISDTSGALGYFQRSLDFYISQNNIKRQFKILNEMSFIHSLSGAHEVALELQLRALKLSEENNDSTFLAGTYFELGAIYNSLGNNKKAFQYSTKSLEIYESLALKNNIWSVLNLLGIIHDDLGMYPEALEYYLSALFIVEELGDKSGQIIMANNIGIIYQIIEDYPKALQYFERALDTSINLDSDYDQAGLHNNIALIYQDLKEYDLSLYHYRRALSLYNREGYQCELSYPLEGLGDLYMRTNVADSAQIYFDRALKMASNCQDMVVLVTAYKSLGRLHATQNRLNRAIEFFQKSLEMAQKLDYRNEIKENALELYKNYKVLGKYKLSLEYHELYKASQDSLFNTENTQRITRLGDEYAFDKERQILTHEQEKRDLQHKAELDTQQLIRNAILIVLLLAVILVLSLGRSYQLIQKSNRKLTRLNEEKNTLIGVVAHDLRSPLNNIRAVMPLIRTEADRLSGDQGEFLEMISLSIERMGDMINRVLDINAIESHKINLKIEACDLSETLDTTAQNFHIATAQKRVGVKKELAYKKHFAHVDKNYLIQVIENILSNAIKFSSPDNNIYLQVEASEGKEMIKIKDEGPGISIQDQKKMFNKYQKLSAKPTANETSTGLGLSIAKKYIEAMKGKIWCESEVGNGTTFVIEFNSIKSSVL